KSRAAGNYAGQLWAFVISMKKGDTVVLPRKLTSQIALGKVTGPYQYRKIGKQYRHTRPVKWMRADIPRTTFEQDLLYSFGAFLTVCNISRNDAARRIATVFEGNPDPGPLVSQEISSDQPTVAADNETVTTTDLSQLAHDQIIAHIQSRFAGHALAQLVDAVLRVDGWATKVSSPGADGGVDILAGRGSLGLDEPRLCVQVKSQTNPCDVTVYRGLQGSMQTFGANQGLLMCWGGFTRAVLSEAKQGHFSVRLWESRDLVEAIYRNYEHLPAEIQAELPLKRAWMLVMEEPEA
ncbi:restriction endonuclease, partial [Thermodesulfobacteriota bacterium]